MDAKTKKKLEELREEVPRYLFRAWNNTPAGATKISGGHQGLNTPDAITPLAFMNGCKAKSVYDLTREKFTKMALAHLTGRKHPETRLSSWASSLSFALNHIGGLNLGAGPHRDPTNMENVYISIIDTKELWVQVEAFYVPELDFLAPGRMGYWHEYLVHGVIDGSAHKAVPMKVFNDNGVGISAGRSPWQNPIYVGDESRDVEPIKAASVRKCREIGDQYGGEFTLPVCLAVLCRKKRDSNLFREGVEELDTVLEGVDDLEIPLKWEEDIAIQPDAEYTQGYGDAEQFGRLMYALLEHEKGREQSDEEDEEEVDVTEGKSKQGSGFGHATAERAAKRAWAKRRSERLAKKQKTT